MMSSSTVFPPLIDHPFKGPFLTVHYHGMRTFALKNLVRQLQYELDEDDPQVWLAKSWYAVSHGADCHEPRLLKMLQEAEPFIREHYPEAFRALALNLAVQGTYSSRPNSTTTAMPLLAEAFCMMLNYGVCAEADVIKVAELLADCQRAEGLLDDALSVLYAAQPFLLGALEQLEFTVAQYEEFREEFIDEHMDDFSPELEHMVVVLRGRRMRSYFPNHPRGRTDR